MVHFVRLLSQSSVCLFGWQVVSSRFSVSEKMATNRAMELTRMLLKLDTMK
uniref:Uncharacterized protein n=1 Tax=Setaria viridis TaxID=4556 RepID=A0A4U6V7Y1_SETVI|nr:hypothetical protein SEVIR_3G007050v2 [Setaria viridis]